MFLYSLRPIYPSGLSMGERGPKPKFVDVACPNISCRDCGKAGFGNVVGNGTYWTKSGAVRKYICRTCSKSFCDRSNTAFYDLRTKDEKVLIGLKLVLRGMCLRGIADVLDVKLDTVRGWLRRAAEHSEGINKVLMKDLKVSKVELDELWTFVQKKQFRTWSAKIKMNAGFG